MNASEILHIGITQDLGLLESGKITLLIQDRYLNSNLDMDDILSLIAEWDVEDCMDTPLTFI